MADNYQVTLSVATRDVGGAEIVLARAAGTSCDEIYLRYTNIVSLHPQRRNWFALEPESFWPPYEIVNCLLCVRGLPEGA